MTDADQRPAVAGQVTVWNECTLDWRHGMPTRKAQLDGMRELCEAHDAAIEALKERLK